jgi:integrase
VRSTINKHLMPVFGDLKPDQVTTDLLNKYRDDRTAMGASQVSINRELVYLRCSLKMGADATPPKVDRVKIPTFPFDVKAEKMAKRTGTISSEVYEKIMSALPPYMKAVWITANMTGFRSKEIRYIRPEQVDLDKGVIRLREGETKNGEPRSMPIDGEAKTVLIEWKRWSDEHYPNYVETFFHKNGKPISTWMNDWYATLEKVGLRVALKNPDGSPVRSEKGHQRYKTLVKFHDTRRTVVTMLNDSGLRGEDIRKGTGHSEAMNRRYDQSVAVEKIRAVMYGTATPAPMSAPAPCVRNWKAELKELKEVFDSGVLPEDEYRTAVSKVMASR